MMQHEPSIVHYQIAYQLQFLLLPHSVINSYVLTIGKLIATLSLKVVQHCKVKVHTVLIDNKRPIMSLFSLNGVQSFHVALFMFLFPLAPEDKSLQYIPSPRTSDP